MSSQAVNQIATPIADEIRGKFIDFFVGKAHAQIPNVSLVPNVDSTLLFTNSGMFPLVNYLSGVSKHPQGSRLVNFQRCIRTGEDDLAEIGDWKHTTMFEMMGNWSIGDYFKAEQIPWIMELYIEEFGIDPKRTYVSVFAGDDDAPRDEEAIALWKQEFAKRGLTATVCPYFFGSENGKDYAYELVDGQERRVEGWKFGQDENERIFLYGKKKNWWQRGDTAGELGGPDSEMFFDTGAEHDEKTYGACHPNSDSRKFLEFGNNVFMQYKLDEQLNWQELPQKNVDFGGGFSRVLLARQNLRDIFETEIFMPIIDKIAEISGKEYKPASGEETTATTQFRIIADHVCGATFVIADGVDPDNKDQGYILRRLIRRAIRMGLQLGIERDFLAEIAEIVLGIYARHYEQLEPARQRIAEVLTGEEARFRKTLGLGVKELQKIASRSEDRKLSGKQLFYVYETYGFPVELSLEELKVTSETERKILLEEFKQAEESHKQASRQGSEAKFTGGLADSSQQTTRLHTAHHLLLRALQLTLGSHVHQRGSNITAERLRIDFSHPDKLTDEQIQAVEKLVNDKIHEQLTVERVELPLATAEKLGAEMEFGQKYGEKVNVYVIGKFEPGLNDRLAGLPDDEVLKQINELDVYSKEFCGGPHVTNTGDLAEMGFFKIQKEQSSGAGVRRIKATLSLN